MLSGIFFTHKLKNIYMADNPQKKGRDSKRVSQQSHEQTYQRRKQNKNGSKDGSRMNGRGSSKKTAG
jgi:hypothetical protein